MTEAADILAKFQEWVEKLAQTEASDLHIKVGSAPMLRERGALDRLPYPALLPQETAEIAAAIIPADRRGRLDEHGEVDFAHSVPGVGRFRVNAFHQRSSTSLVLRKLRFGGPAFDELGLPDVVRRLAEEPRGLVLVAGPTGSGKTTTLAAMVEHINTTSPLHVVTIEDPIEVLFEDKMAAINQREVGLDTESFVSALRVALRQDPDVILVGEMRDPETVRTALQAAETGHLVMSTLHTLDATETINRVVDFFPPHQQRQVRLTMAGSLRGIVCQRLIPSSNGLRAPAVEVLVNTGRVAERIIDPAITAEIRDVIAEGGYYGMQTFEQSLLELVKARKIDLDEAMASTSHPHDFRLMVEQAGLTEVGAIKTL